MRCYCEERSLRPELAEEMKEFPLGYCGLCEICGKPGHTRAHPRLPATGAWCDEHWNELVGYRVFTLGDVVQCLFYAAIIGVLIYSVVLAWKLFFEC